MSELVYVGQTKYKSRCKQCGQNIPIGAPAYYNKETKEMYHTNHKPEALPSVGHGADAGGRLASAQSAKEMLHQARALIATEFSLKIEDVRLDNELLISEVMHTLRSLKWLDKEE